ncbi:MAG: hypothetical protein A3H91_11690 [Gammaproteobacteria bacterium RIFCSPLOWO2_02_FULL_61_13]|nr:MAG: hypothetical protein A3H91_11690 [Gammaproteobacteria bacterium RIFCSPLOWO2_02_FULL_61_13]
MSADSSTTGPAPGNRGWVLVIDDEPGIRRFALRVLESAGYQSIEAGDGRQGLGMVVQQGREIAAVLMDLSMPGMDARDLVHELRRVDPQLPILVMSGYSDAEVAEQLDGLGVSDFVHKPFRPRDLMERLEQALSRKTQTGTTP